MEALRSKSIGRNSRFALNTDHDRLKEMISKRENDLKELLEQSKGQLEFFNNKMMDRVGIHFRTEITEPSPSESSNANKITMKSRKIFNA